MAEFTIDSLRGGMNNTDPQVSLPEDQCILAENVEYIDSLLGERRKGTIAISLPSDISARDRVTFSHRDVPTSDPTASVLWLLGVTGTATAKLCRKTTSWSTVTISDTPTLTGFYQYQWQAVSLHGKTFFAYKSDQNRLHVYDGTSMRRVGIIAPTAAPTAVDTAGAGTFAGTRYYQVRFTTQSSGVTLLRSEPSAVLTKAPSGANTGLIITKPSSGSEGETHWELEASTDNTDFYVLATTLVGTTTVTDTTDFSTGYVAYDLSEDIEDYSLIPSARYLTVDEDRLVWAGSWETAAMDSRVGWTPVFNDPGSGNDERFETDTDPFVDLDASLNGAITGISEPTFGSIWVFKQNAIYKLTRSGQRTQAYAADKYTEALGAIHGSVHSGLDESGQPCIYFLDHEQGPCRIGIGGIKRCGEDIRKTWELMSVDATAVVASCLYYPFKKQMIWNLAISGGNSPSTSLVLHVDKARPFPDGVRKGWSLWTGNRAKALSMVLYADNIDSNTTCSRTLVPYITLEGLGLVHRCDTGTTDNSVAYTATITSRPYYLRTVLNKFTVMTAAVLAKAIASSAITVKCLRDFGIETTVTVSDKSLAATGTETDVIVNLDEFKGAELKTVQVQFVDPTTVSAQWQLNGIHLRLSDGQKS